MTTFTILVIMAMLQEARPFIEELHLKKIAHPLEKGLPMEVYQGKVNQSKVILIVQGKDKKFDVDTVATQPATLSVFLGIKKFKPNIIINAGTAGGLGKKGANIGDVYIGTTSIQFYDRRIPLPGFKEYGVGSYPIPNTDAIAKKLGLKQGIVSTGNSLDTSETDLKMIENAGASVKDMEAAAIAWVADLYSVPLFVLKSITDLIDSKKSTPEEFTKHLQMASAHLKEKLVLLVKECANENLLSP